MMMILRYRAIGGRLGSRLAMSQTREKDASCLRLLEAAWQGSILRRVMASALHHPDTCTVKHVCHDQSPLNYSDCLPTLKYRLANSTLQQSDLDLQHSM